MQALLVHLIGFALIDAAMPAWASEAGWLVLSSWYGAFMAIDMVAIMLCRNYWLHIALAASCSWSACVMIDVSFGSDFFQRHDDLIQDLLDFAMFLGAAATYISWRKPHAVQVG